MALELLDKEDTLNLSLRGFIEVRPAIHIQKSFSEEERKQRRETKKVMDAIAESARKIALSE